MYFLLNIGIFQPAMLVYQRVCHRDLADENFNSHSKKNKQNPQKNHERYTPLKTNMKLENPPIEDVFPIEHGDFPMSC